MEVSGFRWLQSRCCMKNSYIARLGSRFPQLPVVLFLRLNRKRLMAHCQDPAGQVDKRVMWTSKFVNA